MITIGSKSAYIYQPLDLGCSGTPSLCGRGVFHVTFYISTFYKTVLKRIIGTILREVEYVSFGLGFALLLRRSCSLALPPENKLGEMSY